MKPSYSSTILKKGFCGKQGIDFTLQNSAIIKLNISFEVKLINISEIHKNRDQKFISYLFVYSLLTF